MTRKRGAFLRHVYLGGSAEAGGVTAVGDDLAATHARPAGSLFAAADTVLGPLLVAYGQSARNSAVYLSSNRPF